MSNLDSKISQLDVLKGFFTSDLNLVYEIQTNKIFKSITFNALVNNIFNKEYVDRGYYYTFDDTWSNPGATKTVDGFRLLPTSYEKFLSRSYFEVLKYTFLRKGKNLSIGSGFFY